MERGETPQERWIWKQLEAGRCIRCGRKRKYSSNLCQTHLRMDRLRKRKKLGLKSWKRGGLGRPPLEAANKQGE